MPYFKAELKPTLYLDWVYLFDVSLEEKGLLNEESFEEEILKIKLCAYSWYICFVDAWGKEGRSKIETLGELKRYVDKKFLPKGYTHYPKLGERSIEESLTKVEPKEVLEEVICEPKEGDFLGFELKEVVNKSKEDIFEDDWMMSLSLNMLPSLKLKNMRSKRLHLS